MYDSSGGFVKCPMGSVGISFLPHVFVLRILILIQDQIRTVLVKKIRLLLLEQ